MFNHFKNDQKLAISKALKATFGKNYTMAQWVLLQGGGSQHHVYSNIINNKHSIVLRVLSSPNAQEIYCTKQAYILGIGPKLIYHNSANDVMILEKIAKQLKKWQHANIKLNKSPFIIDKINYMHEKCSMQAIEQLGLSNIKQAVQPYLYIEDKKMVPCHGDPNPSNILLMPSQDLQIIDWSNAGSNHPYADYGMIMQYLTPETLPVWLKIIGENQTKTLIAYNKLLQILCCLWAIEQAQNLYQANLEEQLLNDIRHQKITISLANLQKQWLDGKFDNQDPKKYILLAKILAKLI